MENTLILIVSLAILAITVYSAKTVFGGMRKQQALNQAFLESNGFEKADEVSETIKEFIIARDPRIAMERLITASTSSFKLTECYRKTNPDGTAFFFLKIALSGQPKSFTDSVYILAPFEIGITSSYYVHLWSNTLGPGSSEYRSKKRSSFDFGKTAVMNGVTLYRAQDLSDFDHIDFYGPEKGHPETYLGKAVIEMVKQCRDNGVQEISCVDGIALFRIHSLIPTAKPGNVLTDPEIPFKYITKYS